MTVVQRPSLADRLGPASRCGGDLTALADAVFTAFRAVVPFSFACLATIDPATGLISSAYKSARGIGDEDFAAAEYGGRDINQFTEIALRPEPVGVLSIDTEGRPQTCRRFRDFLAPRFGFTDELRVVFRQQGLTWGALALYRSEGEPPFAADDGRTVAVVHEQVAELLRLAVFDTRRTTSHPATGPAVIIIDGTDRVSQITDAARARIEDLGGWEDGSLPTSVLVTSAAARNTPELATTRAIGRSGTWLVVRASTFEPTANRASAGVRADVVITIEAASPADIGTLALAARGLSRREQDVAGMVLQGASTAAIAGTLHLSPHTVQDHLKSIFSKLGVNSRREMVRRLVLT